MATLVAEKIRLVILTDPEIRRALRLAAGQRGVNEFSPIAEEILRKGLAREIEEVRRLEGKKH